jgi:plasmid maintenance system antidote protein VapI
MATQHSKGIQIMGQGNHWRKTDSLLLDALKKEFGCTYDRELAELLGMTQAQLSQYRNGTYNLTPSFILSIHESMGWPTSRIRDLHNRQLINNSKMRKIKNAGKL